MRLNWKFLWLAMLSAFALSLTGCGGVNVGGSVSPASFFVPGAMITVPAPKTGAPKMASQPTTQLAQAR